MRIEISCEQLERVEKILHGIPGAAEKATGRALNRGLSTAKSEASRQIRQRYAIASGKLGKYQKVKLKQAGESGEGSIEFSGPKIPLYQFTVRPGARSYLPERIAVPINAESNIWRIVFKNADVSAMDSKESGMQKRGRGFIATFQSGHTGIFKRTGGTTSGGKAKIEEYWGYAVADMLDYEPAKEAIAEKVQETVNKRLEHEIGRVLDQY